MMQSFFNRKPILSTFHLGQHFKSQIIDGYKKKKKEKKSKENSINQFTRPSRTKTNHFLTNLLSTFSIEFHLRRAELSKKPSTKRGKKKGKKARRRKKRERTNWSQNGIHKSRSHLTFDQPPFPTETDFFFNRQPYPQLSLLDYTFKARSEEACGTHLCRVRVLPTSLPVKQWASAEDREGVTRRVSWSIGPRLRPPYHPLLTQSRELTTTTGKKRTSPYMLPGPRCLYRVTLFDSHQTRSTCWPNWRRNVSPLIGKRGLRVCTDACAFDFFFFSLFLSVQRLFSKYYIKLGKTVLAMRLKVERGEVKRDNIISLQLEIPLLASSLLDNYRESVPDGWCWFFSLLATRPPFSTDKSAWIKELMQRPSYSWFLVVEFIPELLYDLIFEIVHFWNGFGRERERVAGVTTRGILGTSFPLVRIYKNFYTIPWSLCFEAPFEILAIKLIYIYMYVCMLYTFSW